MNKMINLSQDQYLVAECCVELSRSLYDDDRAEQFGERFADNHVHQWLVGVALVIENQVKLAGGWEIVGDLQPFYDFIDRVTDFIFLHMHEFSDLGPAFLKEITRFVQEEIDIILKEEA